ncbi:MAG: hypothetical protein P4K93_02640 [Terracidiphilus sp.]|nr:hypothetical protein [Terracidiphilus sp.]
MQTENPLSPAEQDFIEFCRTMSRSLDVRLATALREEQPEIPSKAQDAVSEQSPLPLRG